MLLLALTLTVLQTVRDARLAPTQHTALPSFSSCTMAAVPHDTVDAEATAAAALESKAQLQRQLHALQEQLLAEQSKATEALAEAEQYRHLYRCVVAALN